MLLSDEDVERIAESLSGRLTQQAKSFWIEPEQHYQDHLRARSLEQAFDQETLIALKDMAKAFRASQSNFWRAFGVLVVVGAIALAVYALLFNHPGTITNPTGVIGK